jgi:hypothetical protein
MRIRVGTSGFAYKEWKGTFYPEKFKDEGMLAYYAERFETVEINNTFYRMPAGAALKWAADTPEHRLRPQGSAAIIIRKLEDCVGRRVLPESAESQESAVPSSSSFLRG